MFAHNFRNSLKVLFKNKMLLFWTFAFPIILGLFFYMAFKDIESNEKLSVFDIAIVNSEAFENDEVFKNAFKALSSDTADKMFNITYTDLSDAQKLLEDDKITGFLTFAEDVKITVSSSGINETILKYVVDEISSNKKMIEDLMINYLTKNDPTTINYEMLYKEINDLINSNNMELNDISNKNLSYTMIEYYTLISMAALYGGILSMYIINYKLPNMNSVGKRIAISPIQKGKMLLGSLLASFLVELIGLALLFIFTIFFIHVDYGEKFEFVVLLACCGAFAGLSLGVAVATLVKSNENTKTGVLIAITMLGCFLSGMMGITMKYIIDKNVPIINIINPASIITDGFYSLYYYDTLNRYIFDIVSLLVISGLLILISIRGLRRQRYDSI